MTNRIQIMGSSGSGKSTVGARLAAILGVPHVELDALRFLPDWVERDDADFRTLIDAATSSDAWVASGNYISKGQDLLWGRANMIVWLDLPLHVTIPRQLTRSWRRWRTQELLWGTNIERFWPQLAIWDPKRSIVGWTLASHKRHNQRMADAMTDPQWAHVRFTRLTSQREIDRFLASIANRIEELA